MATCIQSINGVGFQPQTLANNIPVVSKANSTINGMFAISSSMDQSIFLNFRVLGGYNSVSLSLTIYRQDTMQIFGTMNVTRDNVNSSFNILAGDYYICVRSLVVEYNFEITASYINYSTIQVYSPTSQHGFQSDTILTSKPVESNCNKPLMFEMVDGILPTGLTMLENGYINGTLPMLDTEEYNKDLPTSNTWYEKIHDNDYITPWGRIYRFKVRLYLQNDYDNGVERWLYISIVNDFSKNLRYIDQYIMLEDERVVTLEDQIKLDNIRLCPVICGTKADDVINDNTADIISVVDGEIYKNVSESNKKYFMVEANYTSPDEIIINDASDGYMYDSVLRTELILMDSNTIQFYKDEPVFPSTVGNNGLIEYYLDNINDDDNILIVQLKDSCMFQHFLLENNIDKNIIVEYAYERFDLKDIVLSYDVLDGLNYIKMMNNFGESDETIDSVVKFNELYTDNFEKLPFTLHTMFGFGCEVTLR